jgi:hypothetical protein
MANHKLIIFGEILYNIDLKNITVLGIRLKEFPISSQIPIIRINH